MGSVAIHSPAAAIDITGTVSFQGQVTFAAPIAGIAADDLVLGPSLLTEATDPGENCSVLSVGADNPDPDGTYPGGAGAVTAQIQIGRGGPQVPDGQCLVTLTAGATDGVSVIARGSQLLFVTAADISGNATVAVPTITVRESKAVASLDSECFAWVKKQFRKRRRCNLTLLSQGPPGAARCTDAGPEPPACDAGNHVEALLGLAHGINDQQISPGTSEAVDLSVLGSQNGCQRRFGAAVLGFMSRRMRLVRNQCLLPNADSSDCRDDSSRASKRPLDRVDGCTVDQAIDVDTGRPVPDTGSPCDTCIDGVGVIDRKCLKGCYQLVIDELTDGIIGDDPVCGNGILQPGEICDDGDTIAGDCCSATCTPENLGNQSCGTGACAVTVAACQNGEPVTCTPGTPGTEGPMGDGTCSDAIDNDCDALTDGADPSCN
jgi:cysteine-rich repeat protein